MFDIKCKREGCLYNKNQNCTATELEVTKDTSCKTFNPSNEKEIGMVERVDQPPIRKDIEVGCNADCLFNHEHHCGANGITVQTCDNTACPNCCTYLPK